MERLHSHVEGMFSGCILPSHDQTHHHRVWNICRELLTAIGNTRPTLDPTLVEGTLVAAYFHDLGMARSTREDHGFLGRGLCEDYFKDQVRLPARFPEILEAIELHDIKEKKVYAGIRPGMPPGILDLLSIADDLEAFGTIGIYRYAEIYLKRGTGLRDLGIRILGNASRRFRFFLEGCGQFPGLVSKYQWQYGELVSFFDLYNQQLLTGPDPQEVFHGHLGVVNLIRTLTVEGATEPMDFLRALGSEPRGSTVTNFFKALQHELEKARLS